MNGENLNKNEELLNYMHINAEMGVNTLRQINDIVKEPAFREVIEKQLLEYKNVFDYTERLLESSEAKVGGVSPMLKMSSYFMINMKTLTDKTSQHVAEMIISGGTMGIIDITKKLKEYIDCSDEIKNIGYKLMWIEQKNVDEMKHFL